MKAFYKGEASTKLPSGTPGREVERRIMHEVVREAARKAKQHFVQDYFAYKQVDLGER